MRQTLDCLRRRNAIGNKRLQADADHGQVDGSGTGEKLKGKAVGRPVMLNVPPPPFVKPAVVDVETRWC